MEIEMMDIEKVKPYDRVAKHHPQTQIEVIKDSINQFGFIHPILVDKKNEVICGHARRLAALQLGWKKVPVIKIKHLTKSQIKKFRIAENKSMESTWIDDRLAAELKALEGVL